MRENIILLALALVIIIAARCAPTTTCAPTLATSFSQSSPTEFALRVFAGEPNNGFVNHLTLNQVEAIANKTVYVRLIAVSEYALCPTSTETKRDGPVSP